MTSITVSGKRKALLDDLAEQTERAEDCDCGRRCANLVKCEECGEDKCEAVVPETPSGIHICISCNAELSRSFGTNYAEQAAV